LKRTVTISLGAFARKTLSATELNGTRTPASVVRAIRVYLNDKGAGEPGWAYPDPLRGRRPAEEVEMELSVDEDLWLALEREAADQGVTPQQLLEHAVLYFAAEIDAGRVTQRILEDLGEE
jgi:hypothetical protein